MDHPKWLPTDDNADDDDEREAREREVRGAPAGPAGEEPQPEVRAPHDPRHGRRNDDRIHPVVARDEPREAYRDAEREQRHRPRDRPQRERVERRERRNPAPEDRRRTALEPPLLPDVQPRQPGRERESGEGGEDEADMEDEEERRVAGSQRRPPVPPPTRAVTSSATASGITTSPSSRYGARQPQMRYAETTSQTKRLSDAAHVPHGKPSSLAACATSSAVCASQPSRTPHVASQPGTAGVPRLAEVADGRLAVEEERGPEEKLSHRKPAPAQRSRRPSRPAARAPRPRDRGGRASPR